MYYLENNTERFAGDRAKMVELYSSAYTLSDMEIFVFPELLYSLVLAEIMSDRLWLWREDKWFDGILDMPPAKRISRIKQYIMDHYTFNLDLDTWGLTTKEKELERFAPFLDTEALKKSNALFGYEGDRYYFSMDIRRHFGLDKFDSNAIPYWKTETLEAMDGFVYRDDWNTGGGECVSLSVLYAAALFVVAKIPLKDIFLMATPLHSQNFVFVGEGLLTNNRRIVTKSMFFNGTELSTKARRALENENVTLVANQGQYVHFLYEDASLCEEQFARFSDGIKDFLKTEFTPENFGNFIRSHPQFSSCFSYQHMRHGKAYYIECEKALRYEASTKLKVSDRSRKKLLSMIDLDEFYPEKIPGRLVVNELESFIRENHLHFDDEEARIKIRNMFCADCEETCDIVKAMQRFIHVEPNLPDLSKKRLVEDPPIILEESWEREQIVAYLRSRRADSLTADLSFHAARLPGEFWEPYWYSSLSRSPVSVAESEALTIDELVSMIEKMENESIYSGDRVAQPDEAWNFRRGDGFEKAVMLLNILKARAPEEAFTLTVDGQNVCLKSAEREYCFQTSKRLGPLTHSF